MTLRRLNRTTPSSTKTRNTSTERHSHQCIPVPEGRRTLAGDANHRITGSYVFVSRRQRRTSARHDHRPNPSAGPSGRSQPDGRPSPPATFQSPSWTHCPTLQMLPPLRTRQRHLIHRSGQHARNIRLSHLTAVSELRGKPVLEFK